MMAGVVLLRFMALWPKEPKTTRRQTSASSNESERERDARTKDESSKEKGRTDIVLEVMSHDVPSAKDARTRRVGEIVGSRRTSVDGHDRVLVVGRVLCGVGTAERSLPDRSVACSRVDFMSQADAHSRKDLRVCSPPPRSRGWCRTAARPMRRAKGLVPS